MLLEVHPARTPAGALHELPLAARGRGGNWLTLLRGFLASSPSLDLLDVAFQSTLEAQGPEAAHRLVRDELRRYLTELAAAWH